MKSHRHSYPPGPLQDTAADPTQPLQSGNESAAHQAFEAQVPRREGNHPAVVDDSGSWSYRQLNEAAQRVAHALVRGGIGPGKIVAILAHRNRSLTAALLGVWKAGAAFVVLDPAHPLEHLKRILALAQPAALLEVEESPRQLFEQASFPFHARLPLAQAPEPLPLPTPGPDALAYLVFTSGSTGQPKAIAGTHRPISHFIRWHVATFGLRETDRFSMLSGLGHDPLLRDILTPLSLGATLVIPSLETIQDPTRLAAWLRDSHITAVHLTPSLARLLDEAPAEMVLPEWRHAFFCGEPLTRPVLTRLLRRAPQAECVNFYGTTETPQAMAWHRVNSQASGPIPVGRGIDGVQLLVLSQAEKLAQPGEPGEIYIRSPYLALGYYRNQARTQKRFLPNPFTSNPADRLYRTGDLGRVLPGGEVEILGRADRQIKIRGLRVEPAEIEAAFCEHPEVRQAHVEWRSEQLTAYLVTSAPETPALTAALRRHVRARLPVAMVPAAFMFLNTLPLTPNGKINSAALPPPRVEHTEEGGPADLLEYQLQRIWEELLHFSPIGTHENFFDLGGHSLLAATLFARIGQLTGSSLPLATLFQAPTIAQLAALIRSGGWKPLWNALVPIQPRGKRTPLFLVHPVGGNVLGYRDLTRHLGADQPVFGLQALGLDGTEQPLQSVEAMAAHYLREIRTLRPHGPYLLVGYSSGGIVAYEMAQQLHALREKVPLLVLLDTAPSGYWQKPLPVRLAGHCRILWQVPWREKLRYLRGKLTLIRRKLASPFTHKLHQRAPTAVIPETVSSVLDEIRASNRRAILAYRPKPYPGSAVLFRALQRQRFYENFQIEPDEAWKPLIQGHFTVGTLCCDHGQVLGEPNVTLLARQLRELVNTVKKTRMDTPGHS